MEAFIGQKILAYQDPGSPGELFYWHREERSSSAEVDYVITHDRDICMQYRHCFSKIMQHCLLYRYFLQRRYIILAPT